MATKQPRTFAVDMTLDDIVAMRDVIALRHADQAYYAAKNLEHAETGAGGDRWMVSTIKEARRVQQVCSGLHEVLTGVPLDATEEEPAPEPEPAEVPAEA